ncbi:hypothetical protein VTO42DRAFT_2252 [Malbranchea cinnamomea]
MRKTQRFRGCGMGINTLAVPVTFSRTLTLGPSSPKSTGQRYTRAVKKSSNPSTRSLTNTACGSSSGSHIRLLLPAGSSDRDGWDVNVRVLETGQDMTDWCDILINAGGISNHWR